MPSLFFLHKADPLAAKAAASQALRALKFEPALASITVSG